MNSLALETTLETFLSDEANKRDLLAVLEAESLPLVGRSRNDWRDLLLSLQCSRLISDTVTREDVHRMSIDCAQKPAELILESLVANQGSSADLKMLAMAMQEAGINTSCLRVKLPSAPTVQAHQVRQLKLC